MPLLEVIHASKKPATLDQKRALVKDLITIFRDVLGTPEGRLRVFFVPLGADDSIAGLLASDETDDQT